MNAADLEEAIATADTTPLVDSGIAGSSPTLDYETPTFGVSVDGDDLTGGRPPRALVYANLGSATLSIWVGGGFDTFAEMSLDLDAEGCRAVAAQLLATADRLEEEGER